MCGITNTEDLEVAVDAGADALGFVVDVPASPRSISLDRARDLVEATPPFVQSVLVSVFDTVDQLKTLCSGLAPNAVQVTGSLPRDAICKQFRGIRLIHAVAVNDQAGVALPPRCAAMRFSPTRAFLAHTGARGNLITGTSVGQSVNSSRLPPSS